MNKSSLNMIVRQVRIFLINNDILMSKSLEEVE